jgi:hypothetical protein
MIITILLLPLGHISFTPVVLQTAGVEAAWDGHRCYKVAPPPVVLQAADVEAAWAGHRCYKASPPPAGGAASSWRSCYKTGPELLSRVSMVLPAVGGEALVGGIPVVDGQALASGLRVENEIGATGRGIGIFFSDLFLAGRCHSAL